jgi:hypothetical protein
MLTAKALQCSAISAAQAQDIAKVTSNFTWQQWLAFAQQILGALIPILSGLGGGGTPPPAGP